MTKSILILSLIFCCGLVVRTVRAEQAPMPTRWISSSHKVKPLHDGVLADSKIELKLVAPQTRTAPGRSFSGRICLIVNSNIYSEIFTQINQYSTDLSTDGYSTVIYLYESGGAEGLRGELSNLYFSTESLVGAVLIGNIPHIIYEMVEKFELLPISEYEDFPCDIFYMDLDGGWYDCSNSYPYSSGKYDTRDGNLDLEIWVSRMKTDELTAIGNETEILTNYFNKNHNYREGNLSVTNIALVYNDDPWAYMGEDDADYMQQVYDNTVMITNWNGTTADDYKNNRLTSDYQLIFIRSHGSGTSHGFYTNITTFQSVTYSDYISKNPKALFYSLFACSGEDYTIGDYLGGTTVFNPNANGLLSWGSAKKGGMWKDYKFYRTAAPGASIGKAFIEWFNYVQFYWSSYTPRWWYGMVMTGDASLPFRSPSTYYVSKNGGNIIPFDSWTKAATNIEIALDIVTPGALILVSNGVYNISKMLILSNDVSLKSVSTAENTVINGGFPAQSNICIKLPSGSPSIEGFTISGGYGVTYPNNSGGGISMYYNSKGNVSDCIICGNYAVYGGGIYTYRPVINCVISNNISDSVGGGAYCQGNGYLENCLVSDNYAGGWGGGVYLNESDETKNCIISNNAAHDYAGGAFVGQRCQIEKSIICNNSAPAGGGIQTWVECNVRSCLITDNSATNGGGVFCKGNGTIENCTIVNNLATNFGGGLFCENNRDNTNLIANNIIYYNNAASDPNFMNCSTTFTLRYTHNCTFPEITGYMNDGGNITNKPNFVNSSLNNYHIKIPSYCINSGTNMSWMETATDLDGNARILPMGGTVDMGCYEQIPEPGIFLILDFGFLILCFNKRQMLNVLMK
ncbi:MAG: hypothetical protein DRI44_04255 [Chlamydiae bacterium]|nr:MAG: hypothetical protein DRI44_04255 [Chlamydiota bacterium]